MRRIIEGAASGSSSLLPRTPLPLATVSRLVPSLSISARSPAWEDADRPNTATMAATPIAMPRADSAARSRRVRTPTLATRATSPGRSRAGERVSAPTGLPRRVGDDAPVEDVDAPGEVGGHVVVVGDHDDGGPVRVEVLQHGHDGGARAAVEVAGRLVGQHDRRPADQGPGDGDALALAAGDLGGTVMGAVAEPDPGKRLGRAPLAHPRRHPRVQQPLGDVVEHALVLGEEELLEDEPDPRRPQR